MLKTLKTALTLVNGKFMVLYILDKRVSFSIFFVENSIISILSGNEIL